MTKKTPSPFPKDYRLLKGSEFDVVFKSVDKKISSAHFLYLIKKTDHSSARLGFVVAKKKVKTAVQRNLIKRLHREKFRLLHAKLPSCDIVVLAHPRANKDDKKHLVNSIEKAFEKIQKAFD